MSQDPTKKPARDVTKPPEPGTESSGSGNFQFGDGDAEVSWLRKAANVGLRYTRAISEKSGMRILPILELEDDGKGANIPPAVGGPKPPAPPIHTPQPPAAQPAPAGKSAFGPPEKTLFKTAINQFLDHEVNRPKTQVRFRRADIHMDAPSPALTMLKRVFILVIIGGIGFGAYRAIRNSKLASIANKLRNQQTLDSSEDPLQSPKQTPRKRTPKKQ